MRDDRFICLRRIAGINLFRELSDRVGEKRFFTAFRDRQLTRVFHDASRFGAGNGEVLDWRLSDVLLRLALELVHGLRQPQRGVIQGSFVGKDNVLENLFRKQILQVA